MNSALVEWIAARAREVDLLTSVWLFANGLAVESNPLMRPFAEAGPAAFTLAKLLSFVPAVCYLEWLRWHRPAFAVGLLRFGSAGYTGLYAVPAMIQFLS